MPSLSIINKYWPRLNAQPNQFLVHRNISVIPELYMPPGRAEWEHLFAQYPKMSPMQLKHSITFDCPVVKATPSQEAFWATCMPARPRPHGLWFGWGVELRESKRWDLFIIRGRLVIDGQIAVEGKAHRLAHVTPEDIKTVKAHLVEFVDRLELVLQVRTPGLTTPHHEAA